MVNAQISRYPLRFRLRFFNVLGALPEAEFCLPHHGCPSYLRIPNTQRRHAAAKRTWKESEQPSGLTEKEYLEQIQPRLAGVTLSVLSSTLGVSEPYAVAIRAGRRVPHPRQWLALAKLVGIELKMN